MRAPQEEAEEAAEKEEENKKNEEQEEDAKEEQEEEEQEEEEEAAPLPNTPHTAQSKASAGWGRGDNCGALVGQERTESDAELRDCALEQGEAPTIIEQAPQAKGGQCARRAAARDRVIAEGWHAIMSQLEVHNGLECSSVAASVAASHATASVSFTPGSHATASRPAPAPPAPPACASLPPPLSLSKGPRRARSVSALVAGRGQCPSNEGLMEQGTERGPRRTCDSEARGTGESGKGEANAKVRRRRGQGEQQITRGDAREGGRDSAEDGPLEGVVCEGWRHLMTQEHVKHEHVTHDDGAFVSRNVVCEVCPDVVPHGTRHTHTHTHAHTHTRRVSPSPALLHVLSKSPRRVRAHSTVVLRRSAWDRFDGCDDVRDDVRDDVMQAGAPVRGRERGVDAGREGWTDESHVTGERQGRWVEEGRSRRPRSASVRGAVRERIARSLSRKGL